MMNSFSVKQKTKRILILTAILAITVIAIFSSRAFATIIQPSNNYTRIQGKDVIGISLPLTPNVWIRSANYLNAYLRIDGSQVTQATGSGSGIVNAQYYARGTQPQAVAGNAEVFQLVQVPNSTAFAIRSVNYPNAYLRIDGSRVTQGGGSGSGIVNAQYYAPGTQPQAVAGNNEVFQLVRVANSTAFAIRSVTYPNAYLRIDGSQVTQGRGSGSGIVNAQYYTPGTQPEAVVGNDEVFYISATQ